MTTDRDLGYAEYVKRINAIGANRLHSAIGILGNHGGGDVEPGEGITLAGIATVHEFGNDHNPERSFIRRTVDEQRERIGQAAERVEARMIDGGLTPAAGYDLMGTFIVTEIQQTISRGVPPPNAPATIEKKKGGKNSSKTLIDTGRMRRSITHETRGNDGDG